jgi:hypothetical protein
MTNPELTEDVVERRVHRQLETDREDGILIDCDDSLITSAAAQSVHELWGTSRIKTYLPVLALRRARDQIQATAGLR